MISYEKFKQIKELQCIGKSQREIGRMLKSERSKLHDGGTK